MSTETVSGESAGSARPEAGPPEWPRLSQAIAHGTYEDVLALLRGVPTDRLRQVDQELKALFRETRRNLNSFDIVASLSDSYARLGRILVAALASVRTPAEAAAWIRRPDALWSLEQQLPQRSGTEQLLCEILEARHDAAWFADTAARLAAALSATSVDPAHYTVVVAFGERGGVPLPLTDGYIAGWLWSVNRGSASRGGVSLIAALRAQPRLREIVPRLFETPEVGRFLFANSQRGAQNSWADTLTELAAEGELDRRELIALCARKLLSGDSVGNLRGFHALHDALAPTAEEIGEQAQTYLAMAMNGHPATVKRAQAALRSLDAHRALEPETLAELSAAVFAYTEASLATTQLAWIEAAAKRAPDTASVLFEPLAAAFAHPAVAVERRALTLVAKYAPTRRTGRTTKQSSADKQSVRIDAALFDRLREASAALDPALAAEGREVFAAPIDDAAGTASGIDSTGEAGQSGIGSRSLAAGSTQADDTLPAYQPSAAPDPLADLDELVAAFAPVFAGAEVEAMTVERILAAVAAQAHRDRTALVEALRPLAARYPDSPWRRWQPRDLYGAVRCLFDTLVEPDTADQHSRVASLQQLRRSAPRAPKALYLRIFEFVEALALGSAPPCLLATPTAANGAIDPAVFLDRLAAHRAGNTEPLPGDLQHALLRLPPEPESATDAATAARLRAALAELPPLPGALPDFSGIFEQDDAREPAETTGWRRPLGDAYRWPTGIAIRRAVAAPGWSESPPPLSPFRALAPDRGSLHGFLDTGWDLAGQDLPALLPHHPEVIAAYAVADLFEQVRATDRSGSVLPALAETAGTPGPVTHLALVYGLAALRPEHRVAAVDAVLILAARRLLDPRLLGTQLARTLRRDLVKAKRVVESLDAAAKAGARREVVASLMAAIDTLAAVPQTAGLPDVLLLAARYARAADMQTGDASTEEHAFTRLAELAAVTKPQRVGAEAKRLRRALGQD